MSNVWSGKSPDRRSSCYRKIDRTFYDALIRACEGFCRQQVCEACFQEKHDAEQGGKAIDKGEMVLRSTFRFQNQSKNIFYGLSGQSLLQYDPCAVDVTSSTADKIEGHSRYPAPIPKICEPALCKFGTRT